MHYFQMQQVKYVRTRINNMGTKSYTYDNSKEKKEEIMKQIIEPTQIKIYQSDTKQKTNHQLYYVVIQ